MQHITRSKQNLSRGFTITELSLAMSLLSVLLFILLVSAMGFISIYNKGITLKRVNQSGTNIGHELQASLRHSDNNEKRYVVPGDTTSSVSGVCTGNYSFIWSVYTTGATQHLLEYDTDSGTQPLYFAKVRDPAKDMCRTTPTPPDPYLGNDQSKPYNSTELLGDGLVVRDPSTDPDNKEGLDVLLSADGKLTTVIFTLSTNGGETIIGDGTNRASCQGSGNDQAFCALNTFVITAHSNGVGLNGV